MQNLSESLAGRCGIVSLQPLSAHEMEHGNKLSSIEDYISTGAFRPFMLRRIQTAALVPSYIATYLERDVRNIMHVAVCATSIVFSGLQQSGQHRPCRLRILQGTLELRQIL